MRFGPSQSANAKVPRSAARASFPSRANRSGKEAPPPWTFQSAATGQASSTSNGRWEAWPRKTPRAGLQTR